MSLCVHVCVLMCVSLCVHVCDIIVDSLFVYCILQHVQLLAVSLQESVVHLSDRNGVTVNGEVHFDCNSLIKDWAKVWEL